MFVVLEGARPSAGGLRCSLGDVDEVAIRRAAARAVDARAHRRVLTVPDPKVSDRHARLIADRSGWWIEDSGSTNGTFVNGRRVDRERLRDGDLIEVGHTLLRLRTELPTPEGTADSDDSEAGSPSPFAPTLVPVLARELSTLAQGAASPVPVLLLGQTGTGKELMARAVHAASQRTGRLVAVNCAALPDSLVEAQLFGHSKGAFSGAIRDEVGFVRAADEGTLFLDEVGDLSSRAQGVLLRVLQEGEVVPVGTTKVHRVRVRAVAATHRPIEAMVERGEFRRDLFARLNGFTVRLWPLADRREDVGVIVATWLKQAPRAAHVRIAPEAARALVQYGWPLNARQLVQSMAHALAFAHDGAIELEHLPPAVTAGGEAPLRVAPREGATGLSSRDLELREELVRALKRHGGNVTAVAREMKKAPMQIYRWMQRLAVDPKAFR